MNAGRQESRENMVPEHGWWGGCKGPLGSLSEKGRRRDLLLGAAPLLLVHLLHHLLCLLHARLHPHHTTSCRSTPHTFSGMMMINAALASGHEHCLALLATGKRLQGWYMQVIVKVLHCKTGFAKDKAAMPACHQAHFW